MLVLSRRESEKVLLPALGITIEVTRIQGKTVRLGIDAPDEIRIVRGELEKGTDLEIDHRGRSSKCPKSYAAMTKRHAQRPNTLQTCDLQNCLDAANLAIHLAQNQLRQQLNENAEAALDNALNCLENLEKAVMLDADLDTANFPVREAKTNYRRQLRKSALVVQASKKLKNKIQTCLANLDYQVTHIENGESLIRFLYQNEQPNLVLSAEESGMSGNRYRQSSTGTISHLPSSLRMYGVGSLQKSTRCLTLGDAQITAWFAESADFEAVESYLESSC